MDRARTAWVVAFGCVLLLAVCLRARGLRRWSLNNDEICEVRWSSLPFPEMMSEVRRDAVHPPLDYLVQFAVGRLHGPEWTRRAPAALAGVATVALVMLLGFFWFGRVAGIAAGLFIAVSPIHIRYSQEVRPYSIALLLIVGSLVCLEIYRRSQLRRWAAAWAILVFLCGAALYFAGLVAGVTGIFWIFLERRGAFRLLWRWLPLIVVAWIVLYSPWFPVLRHVVLSPPPGGPEKLDSLWWSSRLRAFAAGEPVLEPLADGTLLFWIAVMAGTIAFSRRNTGAVAIVWLFACGALQMLVLQIRPHFSDPRYLISSLPAAFLLAGAGVAFTTRWRSAIPLAASSVILFLAWSALTLHGYYRGERSDWRTIASYVRERARPADAILLANPWVDRNFGYYWFGGPVPTPVIGVAEPSDVALRGPVWIVTGQCRPRPALQPAGVMQRWSYTERAEVRYLRPGQELSQRKPLCPE